MWTIDAQCPRCCKKNKCKDRPEAIKTMTTLVAKLNGKAEFVNGPGDGIIILSCRDFAVA